MYCTMKSNKVRFVRFCKNYTSAFSFNMCNILNYGTNFTDNFNCRNLKKELLLKYFEMFAKGHYCLKNPPHLI